MRFSEKKKDNNKNKPIRRAMRAYITTLAQKMAEEGKRKRGGGKLVRKGRNIFSLVNVVGGVVSYLDHGNKSKNNDHSKLKIVYIRGYHTLGLIIIIKMRMGM